MLILEFLMSTFYWKLYFFVMYFTLLFFNWLEINHFFKNVLILLFFYVKTCVNVSLIYLYSSEVFFEIIKINIELELEKREKILLYYLLF